MIQSFLSMLSILFLWSQWSVQSKLRSAVSSLTWPWCTVQSPVKCSGLLWSSHYTTILAITEIIRSSLSPGYISQFLCPLSLVWYYPTQAWLCETLTLGLWLPKQDLVILGKNLTLSLSLSLSLWAASFQTALLTDYWFTDSRRNNGFPVHRWHF